MKIIRGPHPQAGVWGSLLTINLDGTYHVSIGGQTLDVPCAWLYGGAWVKDQKLAIMGLRELRSNPNGACFFNSLSLNNTRPRDESMSLEYSKGTSELHLPHIQPNMLGTGGNREK